MARCSKRQDRTENNMKASTKARLSWKILPVPPFPMAWPRNDFVGFNRDGLESPLLDSILWAWFVLRFSRPFLPVLFTVLFFAFISLLGF